MGRSKLLVLSGMAVGIALLLLCSLQTKFSGRIIMLGQSCTKMGCMSENPCCNECRAFVYLERVADTIRLTGFLNGQPITFAGNECEMTCLPFEINKRYELTGKFDRLKNGKKSTDFLVDTYRLISD